MLTYVIALLQCTTILPRELLRPLTELRHAWKEFKHANKAIIPKVDPEIKLAIDYMKERLSSDVVFSIDRALLDDNDSTEDLLVPYGGGIISNVEAVVAAHVVSDLVHLGEEHADHVFCGGQSFDVFTVPST